MSWLVTYSTPAIKKTNDPDEIPESELMVLGAKETLDESIKFVETLIERAEHEKTRFVHTYGKNEYLLWCVKDKDELQHTYSIRKN